MFQALGIVVLPYGEGFMAGSVCSRLK